MKKRKKVRKNNMGSGYWSKDSFTSYSKERKRGVRSDGSISGTYCAQEMFQSKKLEPELNPFQAMRECCDSEEHPNTKPVILALDVTGSMGNAAVEVAKKLNVVMTSLYEKITDVEFLIMGIGDLAYDHAPIQASQFESDIRIAEQLDKIYFEGGGGGNKYESYTAAWYFGSRHTRLDCWNRGKKGMIITMGDEPLNPYLPLNGQACGLVASTGDNLQEDIETKDLYEETIQKFDLYHLAVEDKQTCYQLYKNRIETSFGKYLDKEHFRVVNLDNIANAIIDIVVHAEKDKEVDTSGAEHIDGMISW